MQKAIELLDEAYGSIVDNCADESQIRNILDMIDMIQAELSMLNTEEEGNNYE